MSDLPVDPESAAKLQHRIDITLASLRRRHYQRPFSIRSEYCHENGQQRPCDGLGDPACSENCFTDTTICNGCGTQDKCSYASLIAFLAGDSDV